MPKKDDLEAIKKKLNELEFKVSKLAQANFAYVNAVLQLLADKGITDQKEYKKYLDVYKKQYSKLMQDAEFLKLMRQFKRKGKK